jgi:hypothetical protein
MMSATAREMTSAMPRLSPGSVIATLIDRASVSSLGSSRQKELKGEKQILRLTTPKLKNVWGTVRSE